MDFAAGVGFLNFDMLYEGMERLPDEGEEIYARGMKVALGGGITATMINVHRLGIPVRIATYLGQDFFSRYAEHELCQYGVDYQNFYHGTKSPLCVTAALITASDRTFVSHRENLTSEEENHEKVYQYLRGAKVVEMTIGFLDVYKRLKKDGTILVLDLGWAESLPLEALYEYLALADYFTPNKKEALRITDKPSLEEAADVLSDFFSEVIIKLDQDGCYYKNYRTGKSQTVPPLSNVKAVDSTGAGDAFLSGFIYGLMKAYPIPDCIRFGNVTGGTCVQGLGCLSRYVTEDELKKKSQVLISYS